MAGNTATLQIRVQVDGNGAIKVLDGVGKTAKQAGDEGKRSFDKMGSSAKSLESLLIKIGTAYGGFRVASGFLDTAASFEKLEITLTTLQGSSSKAKESVAWIADFTKKTPYELLEVSTAFQKLTAYGFDATKYLGLLGDTASSMSKDLNSTVEMFADAASFQFERLREFGVTAQQQGNEVTFNWVENNQKMSKTVDKTATDVIDSLETIFARFKGGMNAQSASWEGMMSNLKDNWTAFEKSVMDAGVFAAMKEGLAEVNTEFAEWLRQNQDLIKENVPEYVEAIAGEFAGMPGKIEQAIKLVGDLKEKLSWFVDHWEIIAGIWAGSKFGPWGAGIGALGGLGVDLYRSAEDPKRKTASPGQQEFDRTEEYITRQIELNKAIKDAFGSGEKAAGLYQLLGENFDFAAQKATKATTAVTGHDKAQKSAAKAAADHAGKIANVISNLQWETQMLSLSEDEQYRMNQLKAAGIGINDKMAAGVLKEADAYLVAKKNAEEWKKYADFMSDESLNDMSIQLHKAATEAQEANLKSMEDYNSDLTRFSSEAASQTETAWTEAAKNIQSAWSGFLTDVITGEVKGVTGLLDGMANSLASSVSNKLVAGISEAMATASATGTSAMPGIMSAFSSVNPWMLAGSVGLTALSSVLGQDSRPSYGERLTKSIEELVASTKDNIKALRDQMNGTSALTIAIRELQTGISETKIAGTTATLSESFKIPEGMTKRSTDWTDIAKIVGDAVATVATAGAYGGVGAANTARVLDKGYTSYDYSKQDSSLVVRELMDKLGLPAFLEVMKSTTTDAGAFIDALKNNGLLNGEIPERVLQYYSGGSGKADRNMEVAAGIAASLTKSLLEIGAATQTVAKDITSYAGNFDARNITAYDKAFKDIDTALGGNVESAKEFFDSMLGLGFNIDDLTKNTDTANAAMDQLINATGLSRDEIMTLAGVQQTYNRIIEETQGIYAANRQQILDSMAGDISAYTTPLSTIEKNFNDIAAKGEEYRKSLVDNGMALEGAAARTDAWTASMQELAKTQMINDTTHSLTLRLLQAQGKQEEALAMQREDEIQGLRDTFGDLSGPMEDILRSVYSTEDAATALQKAAEDAKTAAEDAKTAAEDAKVAADALANRMAAVADAGLSFNSAIGKAFDPDLFLKSIGLGGTDLGYLLGGKSLSEFTAYMDKAATMLNAGAITQEQYNSITQRIISQAGEWYQAQQANISALQDATEAAKQEAETRRGFIESSHTWLTGIMSKYSTDGSNDANLSEFAKAIRGVDADMEKMRADVTAAGIAVADTWKAGGSIETAVKNQIRSWTLSGLRSEVDTALAKQQQTGATDLQASLNAVTDQMNKWISGFTEAGLSAEEIASRTDAINSRKDADIQSVYGSANQWSELIDFYNGQAGKMDEKTRLGEIQYWTDKYNAALVREGEQIAAITNQAEASIAALQDMAYSEEDLAKIREWGAAEQARILDEARAKFSQDENAWLTDTMKKYSTDGSNDANLSEFAKAIQDVDTAMEEMRKKVTDAGLTVEDAWKAGGSIETTVKNQIRSWTLSGLRSEVDTALAKQQQTGATDLQASLNAVTDQMNKWISGFTEAGLSASDVASRTADINARKDADIQAVYDAANSYIGDTDKYNAALAAQDEQIAAITNQAEASIAALQDLAYSEADIAKIREWGAAEQTRILQEAADEQARIAKEAADEQARIAKEAGDAALSMQAGILESLGYINKANAITRSMEINDLQARYGDLAGPLIDLKRQEWVIKDYDKAKSDYIDALNKKIDEEKEARQKEIDSISDQISKTKQLSDALESAINSIQEFRNSLVIKDIGVDIGTRYKASRAMLDQAMKDIYSKDAEVASAAAEKLPGLSRDFLDLSLGVNANASDYQKDFAKVMAILNTSESILGVKKSETDNQISALNTRMAMIENSIAIYENMLKTVQAQVNDTRTFAEIEMAYLLSKTGYDNLRTQYGPDFPGASFADGGTISGPSTGYTVATTFHGVEHITPDSQMAEVKEVMTEVRDILIQVRDTNGAINLTGKKTYRILDLVTQGQSSLRTQAVA